MSLRLVAVISALGTARETAAHPGRPPNVTESRASLNG